MTPYKGIAPIIALLNINNVSALFIIGHQLGVSIADVVTLEILPEKAINIATGKAQYLLYANQTTILSSLF